PQPTTSAAPNPAAASAAAGAAATSDSAISPGLAFDLLGAVFEVGSVGPFGGIGLGGAFGGLAITLGELAFPEESALGLGALGALDLIGQTAPTAVGELGSVAGRAGATWASMGKAVPLGSLSVPQAWVAATPAALREVSLVAAQSGTASAAAAAAAAGVAEIPYAEMALAGMAGRAMTATAGNPGPGRRPQLTQPNPTTAPKPADQSEEPDKPARPKAIGVVAELRALVELRDSGVLTQEKFIQRKERLLGE
ncbi:PPE family protein, SVP subgroup, partial [[Mycobacterium] nativiensis]|nr:hypothetical protein [Mycolicibacter sp. MYC340]